MRRCRFWLAGGLGSNELDPGRPGPIGRGVDTLGPEDIPHGRRGDRVAEAGEFAVYAAVAPVGVLGGESYCQLSVFGVDQWPPRCSRGWSGPVSVYEAAVPAEHGLGSHDQEHFGESAAIEGAGEHRQDRPVGLAELGAIDLSLQDRDLVAQCEDLRVSIVAGRVKPTEPGENESGQRSEEDHGGGTVLTPTRAATPGIMTPMGIRHLQAKHASLLGRIGLWQ